MGTRGGISGESVLEIAKYYLNMRDKYWAVGHIVPLPPPPPSYPNITKNSLPVSSVSPEVHIIPLDSSEALLVFHPL